MCCGFYYWFGWTFITGYIPPRYVLRDTCDSYSTFTILFLSTKRQKIYYIRMDAAICNCLNL
jgi:hypothetical protein